MINVQDVSMGFIEFTINERGKLRHIKSVHFKERVAQRSLCDNALIPVLSKTLIYDNGASIKNKGIKFTRDRLKQHLHEFYRKNGFSNDGYVLLIDFKGYFDNILHEPLYEILDSNFDDKRICKMTRYFIEAFGGKSLGIGSQVSQILAVTYRNYLDHYIKQVLRARFYACYMDDSYIISESKEYLWSCLDEIKKICCEYGIKLNNKKVQIVKLSHGFTFMKGQYFLTSTGKVIVKPCKKNVHAERRKLRKFKKMLDSGEMNIDNVLISYNSSRGYIEKEFNCHRTILSMDKLFHELFGYDCKINKREK